MKVDYDGLKTRILKAICTRTKTGAVTEDNEGFLCLITLRDAQDALDVINTCKCVTDKEKCHGCGAYLSEPAE